MGQAWPSSGSLLQRLPALPEAVDVAGAEAGVLSWARAF